MISMLLRAGLGLCRTLPPPAAHARGDGDDDDHASGRGLRAASSSRSIAEAVIKQTHIPSAPTELCSQLVVPTDACSCEDGRQRVLYILRESVPVCARRCAGGAWYRKVVRIQAVRRGRAVCSEGGIPVLCEEGHVTRGARMAMGLGRARPAR